jgi:hypothetical protein
MARYEILEGVCLFGYKSGFIPRLLSQTIPSAQDEPYEWHLTMEKALRKVGYPESTILIDIKPRRKESNVLTLCELVDVWGASNHQWTPLLFHLRGLFVDEGPENGRRNHFEREIPEQHDPDYSVLYVHGSVRDGKVSGKWTAPPLGATNSALLWPRVFTYFVGVAKECTPWIFGKFAT